MEKVLILSAVLFAMAEVLALASLVHSDWLNTGKEVGRMRIGLIWQCYADDCYLSTNKPAEWNVAIFFLTLAILLLAAVTTFIAASPHSHQRFLLKHARRFAFLAIGCLCFVGILFPVGFRDLQIGGEIYNLPEVWNIGNSYKLFWLSSLIFTSLAWCSLIVQLRVWVVAV